MSILDTQIISYAMKGRWPDGCFGARVSSISALEFLLIQGDSATKANYYVPIAGKGGFYPMLMPRRDHPYSKRSTDEVILDFANEFPTLIEFSNLAISQLINSRNMLLFYSATEHLDKKSKKLVRGRLEFLLTQQITSIPLTKRTISIGFELLSEFVTKFQPKLDLRNTINDVLILATAVDASTTLTTEDSTLSRFAADLFKVKLQSFGDHVTLDFSDSPGVERRNMRESKEYINRGWQFKTRKNGTN